MIVLVKGNTKPDLDLALRSGGQAVDLTGTTVSFKLKKPSGAIVTKAMTISDPPTSGRVTAAWGASDLDEAGECFGEVVVDYGGGAVQNSKYPLPITIRDEYEDV